MNIRKVITNFGPDKTLSEVLFTCENRRWKVYDWCEGTNAHGFLLLLRKEKERAGIKRAQDGGYVLVEVEL